ncbi:hypothetical protein [Spirosoma profusum]|nr:hypothetical protein [Spirosoma profusum]
MKVRNGLFIAKSFRTGDCLWRISGWFGDERDSAIFVRSKIQPPT